jgi:hypothetical protein
MKIPLSLVKPILTISSLVAVASITLETTPAAAACLSQPCVTVEVEGIKYDVSYKTGSFGDLESELSNQVWWGNENLTRSFAQSVGLLLGTSDIGRALWDFPDHALRSGPIFAYRSLSYSGLGMSAWEGQTWMDVYDWQWLAGLDSGTHTRVTLDWEYLGVYDYEFPNYQAPYAVASPSAVPEPLTLGGTLLALVAGKIAHRRAKQR